ncbi:MAG: hypothetical protein KatS3mg065_0561 [Chloroflexota bacterium]|nr:MAG: hypothetical protein KatS3mg065_0561 [Chloroflexota bacterium]
MALAPPARGRAREGFDEVPTSPLRVYAADHQPIRLFAELEGITPAELVHRALAAYLDAHGQRLAEMTRQAQRLVEDRDLEGLAAFLAETRIARRAAREARLATLRRQPGAD